MQRRPSDDKLVSRDVMRTRWAMSGAGAALVGAFLTGGGVRAQETSPPDPDDRGTATTDDSTPAVQATVQPSTPAPSSSPPAPPSAPPSPPAQQSSVTGQWVYTSQYGWIWIPYGS